MSIARIAVASSERTEIVACGRAKPTRKPATASRRIAAGRCRRQPGHPVDDVRQERGLDEPGRRRARAGAGTRRSRRRRQARAAARAARAARRSSLRPRVAEERRSSSRSQSPCVEQHDVPRAGRGDLGRDLAALLRGRGREPRAQPRRSTCRPAAAGPSPGSTSEQLRRASAAPARARRGSRPPPRGGGRRASSSGRRQSRGPRKSETTTTYAALPREVADAQRAPRRSRSRRPCVGARLRGLLLAQGEQQAEQARPSLPRRQRARLLVAEGDEAEPVAAARRRVADRERGALGDVGLPALGRAEASSTARCRARAR